MVHHLTTGLTLARMVPGKDELLVVPENLTAVAGRHEGLQAAQFPAYLQIALAHELIRDVLDRRYRLTPRLTATRDSEEFQVLLALWEGKAFHLGAGEIARNVDTECDALRALRPAEPLIQELRPRFDPRGGLGLYVLRGAASFRDVRVEPLDGD